MTLIGLIFAGQSYQHSYRRNLALISVICVPFPLQRLGRNDWQAAVPRPRCLIGEGGVEDARLLQGVADELQSDGCLLYTSRCV